MESLKRYLGIDPNEPFKCKECDSTFDSMDEAKECCKVEEDEVTDDSIDVEEIQP